MSAQIEKIELDLTNVPIRPTSKKEIQQLETALIIGTLYRPEVVELIRDPLERATWVDSLAVAAAALAREKAGYTISQIAEEVGRSEAMIRAHLQGKTKAGKLVRETYELLARGKLKLVVPFTGVHLTIEEYERLKVAEEEVKKLKERIKELEKENAELKKKLQEAVPTKDIEQRIKEFEETLKELEKENAELRSRLKELEEKASKAKELEEKIGELEKQVDKLRKDLEEKEQVIANIKRILGC